MIFLQRRCDVGYYIKAPMISQTDEAFLFIYTQASMIDLANQEGGEEKLGFHLSAEG